MNLAPHHVFLTVHTLVHTGRSTDTSFFPVRYPFPNVYFARSFVILGK
jgi:hypothetical protein